MTADQAAGLRRRQLAQPACSVTCFFELPDDTPRLAAALHARGLSLLLVDSLGRQYADASPRCLFDASRQLAERQLHTLPQAYGEGWFAPGLEVSEAALGVCFASYDCVLFDAGPLGDHVALPAFHRHACVVAVDGNPAALHRAYRFVKTVSHAGNMTTVFLLGDAENCATVLAASRHFLGQDGVGRVVHLTRGDDAFAELAGRMAHEEMHRTVRSE